MKKTFLYLTCIGVLNILLFIGVFRILQNEKIYHNTLNVISKNYERIGDWNNYEIIKTSKPFLQIKNENFENWDAAIYKCIGENMYSPDTDCYGKVRAAFFPLFPLLWKSTNSSPIGISIINYLIFIISIALLVITLLNTTIINKMITFAVLITLPSTIVYYIPYSESLFLFTMMLATFGIIKKKYWVYFIGCFLLAMVRPATVFVLFAILFAELLVFLTKKNIRLFLKEVTAKTIPFLLGYFCVIFIQFFYSGSWTALFEARKHWNPAISFNHFSDWSVEGFGLSLFGIFFLCLPAIGFLFFLFLSKTKFIINDYTERITKYKNEYLFIISIVYLLGIFVFTLVTQGLDFHSFSRYMLASPLFYIAVLIFLNYIWNNPIKFIGAIYFILTIAIIIFINFVDYGGDKTQFPFFGLYLFILTGLFLIVKKWISNQQLQLTFAFILILLNTVWNTYLLNVFFSNGWLFT